MLSEFLEKNFKEIISKGLSENFHLHLINLHDHNQINRENFSKIVKLFQEMRLEKFKK
jgi:hypothetical protein